MERILRGLFLVWPLLAGCTHLHAGAAIPLDLRQEMRKSQLVFRGTVRQLGAATMPGVPVSASTAVVTVDEVIYAPAAISDLTGKDVTVALRRPGSARQGQQIVFFTAGWIYGKGLAVREVDRLEGRQTTAGLRQALAEAVRRNEEADLAERIARAELVVVGRIVSIAKVPRQEHHPLLSEHDPDLHRAFVQVEAVLKGKARSREPVSFLFANSRDVFWVRSPKPKEGQQGVWLLLRNEEPSLSLPGLTVFDARDVQPPERAATVRRLAASQGPPEP